MIITDLSKMLLAVSSIGIFITQEDGHRYIHVDIRELSCRFPTALLRPDFHTITSVEDAPDPIFIVKHYGSYLTALHRIESWLPEKLLDIYDNMDYANTIVGLKEVE